ncbi:MAG: DUF92 domain-containing protein [Ignavibacteriaceae bacterium]
MEYLLVLLQIEYNTLLSNFILSTFLAAIVAFISFKFKFLTVSGIIGAVVLSLIIFTFGTWKWTIPVFTFFFLSSLLSKVREKRNTSVDTFFEKSGQRDYMQVFSNGGFAGLLVIINYFNPSELFYAAYVSSIAAVCSDTWATEIGTMSHTKTYNILNFTKVEQGVSGGISLPGLLGSCLGAIIIALSSLFWIEADSLVFILLILLSGFSASIIDSILGASLQVQYRCADCGKITENKIHCGKPLKKIRGLSGLNNDFVNLVSGISGAVIGYTLTDLILY